MYFERSFKAVIYSLQAAKLCAFVVTRKIFLWFGLVWLVITKT